MSTHPSAIIMIVPRTITIYRPYICPKDDDKEASAISIVHIFLLSNAIIAEINYSI